MVDDSETMGPASPGPGEAAARAAPAGLGGALEDLRAFCTVVELGSVSGAARALDETKGGISRRVSRLERRLGTALLARTPRAVTATEEGMAFYAKAREALALLADAAEGMREAQSVPRGHLRVTAPIDIGIDVLPDMVARFRSLYPQITVELLLTSAALDLAAHRIDLALRATSAGLPDMEYRASPLADFDVCLYATPAYLAARGAPDRPADLGGHDLVVPRDFVATAALSLTNRRGRTEHPAIRPVIRTGEFASVARVVQASGGIGPLPEIVAAPAVATGALRRVLPAWTVSRARLHAISLGGRDAPARVRLFRDFVRHELAQLGAAGVAPAP